MTNGRIIDKKYLALLWYSNTSNYLPSKYINYTEEVNHLELTKLIKS